VTAHTRKSRSRPKNLAGVAVSEARAKCADINLESHPGMKLCLA
jgi:hypothetical protein